jgi:hypothetical protein
MNRREFLQSLGIMGAVVATPKFIFDVGKNLHVLKPEVYVPSDEDFVYFRALENMPSYSLANIDRGILLTTRNLTPGVCRLGIITENARRGDWVRAWRGNVPGAKF